MHVFLKYGTFIRIAILTNIIQRIRKAVRIKTSLVLLSIKVWFSALWAGSSLVDHPLDNRTRPSGLAGPQREAVVCGGL